MHMVWTSCVCIRAQKTQSWMFLTRISFLLCPDLLPLTFLSFKALLTSLRRPCLSIIGSIYFSFPWLPRAAPHKCSWGGVLSVSGPMLWLHIIQSVTQRQEPFWVPTGISWNPVSHSWQTHHVLDEVGKLLIDWRQFPFPPTERSGHSWSNFLGKPILAHFGNTCIQLRCRSTHPLFRQFHCPVIHLRKTPSDVFLLFSHILLLVNSQGQQHALRLIFLKPQVIRLFEHHSHTGQQMQAHSSSLFNLEEIYYWECSVCSVTQVHYIPGPGSLRCLDSPVFYF